MGIAPTEAIGIYLPGIHFPFAVWTILFLQHALQKDGLLGKGLPSWFSCVQLSHESLF